MNQWIFLRHGESEANKARVFSGHQDVALTARGRDQAVKAGIQIQRLLGHHTLDSVWSSDLQRARNTAQLALSAANIDCAIQEHTALRERYLGDWQGQSIDRLKQTGERDILLTWKGAAPGGESLEQLCQRAIPVLSRIQPKGATLVVAHGGLIRSVLGLLDEVSTEEIGRIDVANAVPIVRMIPNGRWTEVLNQLEG